MSKKKEKEEEERLLKLKIEWGREREKPKNGVESLMIGGKAWYEMKADRKTGLGVKKLKTGIKKEGRKSDLEIKKGIRNFLIINNIQKFAKLGPNDDKTPSLLKDGTKNILEQPESEAEASHKTRNSQRGNI